MHPTLVCLQLCRRREGLRAVIIGTAVLCHLMAVVNMVVDLLAIGGREIAALTRTLVLALVVHDPQVHVQQFVFLKDTLALGTRPLGGGAVFGANVFAKIDTVKQNMIS